MNKIALAIEVCSYISTRRTCTATVNSVNYRITGYFRSRNSCITHAKLNFEGFIFVHFQLQNNLSIRDLLPKSFIFEGVALFEIFENITPSKITRYTVNLSCTSSVKYVNKQLFPYYVAI